MHPGKMLVNDIFVILEESQNKKYGVYVHYFSTYLAQLKTNFVGYT